jgi:hypothetical protein
MDLLKTVPKPMKVYKPYSVSQNPPPVVREEKTINPNTQDEEAALNLSQTPPPPQNMMIQPMPGATVFFPAGPPPNQLFMYQIVPGPAKSRPSSLHPSDIPPGQPLNGAPPSTPSTGPKTKPRTVHEYYDQHSFQWREFNPEDTVIGDESDPFIVYFRYANKSIGARRTPWLLPKHIKLIKIMQDCLPDFDWRTGEDLLVFFVCIALKID